MADTFRAFVADEKDGKYVADFRDMTVADLPAQGVLVDVAYSTVNYKDGLAVTGKGKIAPLMRLSLPTKSITLVIADNVLVSTPRLDATV